MTEIIPAILKDTPEEFALEISLLPQEVNYVHVDVLENDVWSPITQNFEAHLMVSDPVAIMDKWIERGAKRIIVHKDVERTPGVEYGLGVELEAPIPYELIPKFNFVHLMSIAEIGAQGRPFDERIFDRIKELREKFPNLTVSVDGGIDTSNYKGLVEAGADRLIIGSHLLDIWASLTKE